MSHICNCRIKIGWMGCLLALSISACNDEVRNAAAAPADTLQAMSDDSLLTLVQYQYFNYFWEAAEPNSGMARERYHMDGNYPQNDKHIVTTGGTGFGLMAIVMGMERNFITRQEGLERFERIVTFLKNADRFHGAWPHWLNGETGSAKAFSPKDDGGDLVETAFLVQGLLTVRQYLKEGSPREQQLASEIDTLWQQVEWDWYQKGENVLYWHWSPNYGWQMNFPVTGYNEALIMYVLAAASPTHPIPTETYHQGWARGGNIRGNIAAYGYNLELDHNGAPDFGGPLFWAHYSFLGLNPKGLKDRYADYWQHNVNHSLINYTWCVKNPNGYEGYGPGCWGLTSSYSVEGYAGHRPGEDLGVIAPTAALSSFPYTPEESMAALKHFYYNLGEQLWGPYGFYDAFSEEKNWFPKRYLAIDQGPVPVMIENHRTGLLWQLFMSSPEIKESLKKLDFEYDDN